MDGDGYFPGSEVERGGGRGVISAASERWKGKMLGERDVMVRTVAKKHCYKTALCYKGVRSGVEWAGVQIASRIEPGGKSGRRSVFDSDDGN